MNEVLSQTGLQVGAGGLVALIVLMVLTGRLVARRQLDDLRSDRDAQLAEVRAERDTWRAAAQSETAARLVYQAQASESLELSRTAVHLLTALPLPSANGVTASAVVQPASPAS